MLISIFLFHINLENNDNNDKDAETNEISDTSIKNADF